MDETWAISDIDYADYVNGRSHIELELRKLLGRTPKSSDPKQLKALRKISTSLAFDELLGQLAAAAMIYKVRPVRANFHPYADVLFTPVEPRKGRPKQSEVRALLVDVQKALKDTLGVDAGIYQNDDGAEGVSVQIARILARSVDKPLSEDLRKQIKQARRTKPTFYS